MKANHTCQICGTPYYACRKCEEVNSPRQTTDKNGCYAIYVILTAIKQGVMTNAEAKTKLVNMGYNAEGLEKNKDNFLPEIYAWLVEIVGKPVKIERAETRNK